MLRQLEKVTLQEGLKSVPEECFLDGQLVEVRIPKSVQTIEENAFYGCGKLEKIVFARGSKLAEIKSGAFQGCRRLLLVIIPKSTRVIAEDAFPKSSKII